MAQPLAITLHALGAETGDGAGAAVDLLDAATGIQRRGARLTLVIFEGTALVVFVDTSPNGTSGWQQSDAFEASDSPKTFELNLHALERFVRVRWEGAGEFVVAGTAHQLFLTEADVTAEVPGKALDVTRSEMADALIKASDDILDALNSGYTPPIRAAGDSARRRGGQLAARQCLSARGNQFDGPDETVRENAEAAEKWLQRVSQGKLRPTGVVDSTPEEYEGGAVVVSGPRREW